MILGSPEITALKQAGSSNIPKTEIFRAPALEQQVLSSWQEKME